jgi:ATP synthase protein I
MKKNSKEIVRALAMVTQLGISMMAPMILCIFVGNWLDEQYGWSTTAVLLILGLLAGARNTWILVKQEIRPGAGRRKENERQEDQ